MTFWGKLPTIRNKFYFHNLISSFFFCGYFWFMPGTFTSLVTVLISSLQFLKGFNQPYLIPIILLIFSISLGSFAVKKVLAETSESDPRWVVIDEVAGQALVLLIVPQTFLFYFYAFIGFRIFDILKPFPIRNMEKIKGFAGVFADDILAGIFAGILIRVIIVLL